MIRTKSKFDLFREKFQSDILWNVVSFGIIGLIGIIINILILKYYSSEALGGFNQIYSFYIVLSQLAVAGIHLSVMRYIPQYVSNSKHADTIISGAIILVILSALSVILLATLFRTVPGKVLDSRVVSQGFWLVLPGLFFFSINKVLLAFLNGLREMKLYAILQALRFVFMMIFLLIIFHLALEAFYLASIFSLAEGILFLLVSFSAAQRFQFSLNRRAFEWVRIHYRFGKKAFVGNLLLDLNSRVDVLTLGLFAGDNTVGIYSFASTLADGFNQFPYLVRTNLNPVLTRAYYRKNGKDLICKISRRLIPSFYKSFVLLGALVVLVFPLLHWFLGLEVELLTQGWPVLGILVLGIVLSSGYLPFQLIFNQIGLPFLQTMFILLFVLVNIILNFILIPLMGLYGAACATALAFVIQVYTLKLLLKRRAGIQI